MENRRLSWARSQPLRPGPIRANILKLPPLPSSAWNSTLSNSEARNTAIRIVASQAQSWRHTRQLASGGRSVGKLPLVCCQDVVKWTCGLSIAGSGLTAIIT
ncbi:hypothetical protein PGT21_002943 [Puccinia graminis f. sp. tritici]|uniref:Uncharacterized protein n=1 Tax=Puccinia graminis f. sp. tritici TaxID=56615 RepID=A0A5B0NL90_PUCGR|nr:hypothetical protein PGT21_002943 [Puccinia graminis f. sp. tritici]